VSSIDFLTKTVIWTDNCRIGLNQDWVDRMLADGYTLIDQRKGVISQAEMVAGDQRLIAKGVNKILKWLKLKI